MFFDSLNETEVKSLQMESVVWKYRPTGAMASRQSQGRLLIAEELLTAFSCVCNASTLTHMDVSHIRSLAKFYGHSSNYHAAQPKDFHFSGTGSRVTAIETTTVAPEQNPG